jgi:GTP cyclohydrolase II
VSAELTAWPRVTRVATTRIPTRHAEFVAYGYRDEHTGEDHVVLVLGDLADADGPPPLVRLHSECLTGDALGSRRCDCRDQLDSAQAAIAAEGRGAVVYMRGHEGRGIGLSAKLRAYELQDDGFDTIDANEQLGFDADERIYAPAATMLTRMGIKRVRLMTNNPQKIAQLERYGIEVAERVAHSFPANGHNENYLRTKAERAGHLL